MVKRAAAEHHVEGHALERNIRIERQVFGEQTRGIFLTDLFDHLFAFGGILRAEHFDDFSRTTRRAPVDVRRRAVVLAMPTVEGFGELSTNLRNVRRNNHQRSCILRNAGSRRSELETQRHAKNDEKREGDENASKHDRA